MGGITTIGGRKRTVANRIVVSVGIPDDWDGHREDAPDANPLDGHSILHPLLQFYPAFPIELLYSDTVQAVFKF